MNAFDTAAVLIAIAALTGYINHRVLKLSATTGTLAVALVSSLVIVAADVVVPAWGLRGTLTGFLGGTDFNEALMHGMLCFLLFAGSLHIDLEGLLQHKWTIGALATVGVTLSTLVVGTLTWWALGALGVQIPFVVCLVFGSLISPTDPIAVMGLLKELRAPRGLEAQIAGESLFNDGIAVVVFFALVSVAGLSGTDNAEVITLSAAGLATLLVARLISVSVPITVMSARRPYRRGIVPILTWCGLRGGISVAMMLSLPSFPGRDYLLACTCAVVVFSILVQGLTVRRVLVHYGVGDGATR
ncbi:MAG: cation:proton antiporter [Acidobacteria bacterium]|nr:cation:proton antiporter [Acidobacteriota bacterium]